MNTQLSPDEIGRYKQEMMRMFQSTGKASGGGNQKTTAVSDTSRMVYAEANEIAPTDIAAEANQTAASVLEPAAPDSEKSSLTIIAGHNAENSSPKFTSPDLSYIERITASETEPEYTGRSSRIQTPDTGAIGVPDYPGIASTGPAAAPNPPGIIQTPDIGEIAAPDFSEDEMGTGYLRVQVHTANRAIPVPDAMLIITEETPLGRKLVRMNITDENGYSDLIPLEVPVLPLDEFPNPEQKPYRDYRLSAFADGYYIVPRIEVPIFANIKSLQSVEMVPLAENTSPLSLFPSATSESDTSITSIEFEQT